MNKAAIGTAIFAALFCGGFLVMEKSFPWNSKIEKPAIEQTLKGATGAESRDSQERKLDKELKAEQDELKKLITAPQLISKGEREKRIAQLLESSFDKAARIQELRIARMQALLDFNRKNRSALIQEARNRAIGASATSPETDSAFVAQRP